MNILIQGIGGIGGISAAGLARAGLDVTPVTGNPEIADVLNTRGFILESAQGEERIPLTAPACAEVPTHGGPYDLIILATQSTTLERAILQSRARLAPEGQVLCFQNGLPEDRVARHLAPERVLGCVVAWGASMVRPGVYTQTSEGAFQLGRPFGPPDARLERVAELLTHIAPVRLTTNLPGVRWSKLAINAAITTMGAIGGDRLGRLLRHRFVRRLALEVFTEVVEVTRELGVRLEKVNGTFHLESVALSPEERLLRLGAPSLFYKHSLLLAIGTRYRRMRSSMLYALERGREPEVAFLNGEIVERGAQVGVPTPINQALVEAVGRIVRGQQKSAMETLLQVYTETRAPGSKE